MRNVGFELQVRGLAIIQPAMEQMALEHALTFRDVDRIVGNSLLVPTGHEEPFARGLLSGLRGDMVQALSGLVPQFENGLRCLLSAKGVEISSMDKMHVQDVRMMGSILNLSELEEILGPDVVKEMKVLFTDDHGIKLRDRPQPRTDVVGRFLHRRSVLCLVVDLPFMFRSCSGGIVPNRRE